MPKQAQGCLFLFPADGRALFQLIHGGALRLLHRLGENLIQQLFEDGFAAAWEQLRQLCDPIRLCPECANCPEQRSCMNCAAVTFSETGRFDGKPEYMCRMNRAYRETVQKMAKE